MIRICAAIDGFLFAAYAANKTIKGREHVEPMHHGLVMAKSSMPLMGLPLPSHDALAQDVLALE